VTAAEVLAEARRLGVELRARGGQLACSGPGEVLRGPFLERLTAHKAELVRILARRPRRVPVSHRRRAWPEVLEFGTPGWRGPEPRPWRCTGPFCRDRGKWWISIYNKIFCRNCVTPACPGLVKAEGDASNAPLVHPENLTEPFDSTKGPTRPGNDLSAGRPGPCRRRTRSATARPDTQGQFVFAHSLA
jgi:hypothetical protein